MELEVDASGLFQASEYANYERCARRASALAGAPSFSAAQPLLPPPTFSTGALHIINSLTVTGMNLHQSVRSQPTNVDTVQFDGIVRSSGSRYACLWHTLRVVQPSRHVAHILQTPVPHLMPNPQRWRVAHDDVVPPFHEREDARGW